MMQALPNRPAAAALSADANPSSQTGRISLPAPAPDPGGGFAVELQRHQETLAYHSPAAAPPAPAPVAQGPGRDGSASSEANETSRREKSGKAQRGESGTEASASVENRPNPQAAAQASQPTNERVAAERIAIDSKERKTPRDLARAEGVGQETKASRLSGSAIRMVAAQTGESIAAIFGAQSEAAPSTRAPGELPAVADKRARNPEQRQNLDNPKKAIVSDELSRETRVPLKADRVAVEQSVAPRKTEELVKLELDRERWKIEDNRGRGDQIEAQTRLTQTKSKNDAQLGREDRPPQSTIPTEQIARAVERQLVQTLSATPESKEAADSARMFNELARQAKVQMNADGSSMASIRMRPESLGHLTLHLQVNQNHVHAQAIVESDAARRMIEGEIEKLRQELRQQGIQVESVSIRVRESAESGDARQFRSDDSAANSNPLLNQQGRQRQNASDQSGFEAASSGAIVEQASNEYEQSAVNLHRAAEDLRALDLVA